MMISELKKTSNNNFDISMDSLNFVWSFWPGGIIHYCVDTDSIGLYGDDGLLIFKDSTKIKVDRIMRHRELKDLGFKTRLTTNIKQCNLYLMNSAYETCENCNPSYVHPNSNHPTLVINHILSSTEFRISVDSSNEKVFNRHRELYNCSE